MHSLSVPFIFKGPVIPLFSVQSTPPKLCLSPLFSDLMEPRRQGDHVRFPLEKETAVYLAYCGAVVLFSKIT